MQIIPIFLFAILCGYSLVIAAPIDQNKTSSDSLETKQQKATAIASRLLKEIANEQHKSDQNEESSTNDENKNVMTPLNHPETEKAEAHLSNENDDSDDENIDLLPIIHDLYEVYGNRYEEEPEDEDSSSELMDNDYVFPPIRRPLASFFDEEESDENLQSLIHEPVMDDSIMAAENH